MNQWNTMTSHFEAAEMTDCLGCNFIETAPILLDDGRTVCATCPVLQELAKVEDANPDRL